MIRQPKRNGLHSITLGRDLIEFRVKRSQRKTLAITVQPTGVVVVTARERGAIETLECKMRKRRRWIQYQRRYFERFLPPTPPRRYVSGETHRYLGRQYRLKVSEHPPYGVKLSGHYLHVAARTKATA